MNSGCRMEYALKEKKNHHPSLREKTSSCANSDTPSAGKPSNELTLSFLTDLSNLLNLLGYSSFLEQLL